MRAIWALVLLSTACTASPGGAVRPEAPRLEAHGCRTPNQHLRPLVVEWSSGQRASIEALARRQLVVVHWTGCELTLLRGCKTAGSYEYIGITPKRDRITMRDRNELYAKLPLGAAELGGELDTSGELCLDMTTAGMLESDVAGVRVDQLSGECDGATHVVSAIAVGAFELSSGSSARVGAHAGAFGAKTGGESESSRRSISRDGDFFTCIAGESPSERCSALLRLELLPLGAHRPLCTDRERWNGEVCEPLLLPVPVSERKRQALDRACKLGLKYACKVAELVGEK